jgi:hypothetical protein
LTFYCFLMLRAWFLNNNGLSSARQALNNTVNIKIDIAQL